MQLCDLLKIFTIKKSDLNVSGLLMVLIFLVCIVHFWNLCVDGPYFPVEWGGKAGD